MIEVLDLRIIYIYIYILILQTSFELHETLHEGTPNKP